MLTIRDEFTFWAENYKFHPKYKAKMWDGKISLINHSSGLVYYGLVPAIAKFLKENDVDFTVDRKILDQIPKEKWTDQTVLNLYNIFRAVYEPKYYQIDAVKHCMNNGRSIILAPTASGKSFILYGLARYMMSLKKRTLLIVPRSALVNQMSSDFIEYNNNEKLEMNLIPNDKDRDSMKLLTISTWQSIYDLPKKWFDKFDCILADEVHGFKATSLVSIMEKSTNVAYRFGFTGSLDDIKANKLTLTGLFGEPYRVATTKQLMDGGDVTDLNVNMIKLNYPLSVRRKIHGLEYPQEVKFLCMWPERNEFLIDLANILEGNTLLLFKSEKHGKELLRLAQKKSTKNLHFSNGNVKVADREDIRAAFELSNNNLAIVSAGTFSTGTNIKNLHHVIFGQPFKSKITVIQSVGRLLRLAAGKLVSTLHDVGDDLTFDEDKNYALKHFMERFKIYKKEQFKVTEHHHRMKDDL